VPVGGGAGGGVAGVMTRGDASPGQEDSGGNTRGFTDGRSPGQSFSLGSSPQTDARKTSTIGATSSQDPVAGNHRNFRLVVRMIFFATRVTLVPLEGEMPLWAIDGGPTSPRDFTGGLSYSCLRG